MNAKESLVRLKEGNIRFVDEQPQNNLQVKQKFESLVDGQQPYAIILGCADSRVVPDFAFDAGLGELFVIRVGGNVANTSSIATVEFAIINLEIKLIVVMGHSSCEAVKTAIAGGDNGHNLNHLLSFISPAIASLKKGATVNEVAKKNAELSVENLKSKSEIISNAIDNEGVIAVPAFYNIDSGKVDFI